MLHADRAKAGQVHFGEGERAGQQRLIAGLPSQGRKRCSQLFADSKAAIGDRPSRVSGTLLKRKHLFSEMTPSRRKRNDVLPFLTSVMVTSHTGICQRG